MAVHWPSQRRRLHAAHPFRGQHWLRKGATSSRWRSRDPMASDFKPVASSGGTGRPSSQRCMASSGASGATSSDAVWSTSRWTDFNRWRDATHPPGIFILVARHGSARWWSDPVALTRVLGGRQPGMVRQGKSSPPRPGSSQGPLGSSQARWAPAS
jgi:hypothetical protein